MVRTQERQGKATTKRQTQTRPQTTSNIAQSAQTNVKLMAREVPYGVPSRAAPRPGRSASRSSYMLTYKFDSVI